MRKKRQGRNYIPSKIFQIRCHNIYLFGYIWHMESYMGSCRSMAFHMLS